MNGLTQEQSDFYKYSTGAIIELTSEVKKIREAVEKCTGRPVPSIPETPAKDEHPTDCLAVTKVIIRITYNSAITLTRTKALVDVILNDQIQIRGLRVMDGDRGLYVAYPPDMFGHDESETAYSPITRQLREHIKNCVLEKYMEATK